ncbi:hypothetical protein [Chitinophaga pinensis]|uniref:Uncharacterized protein n=1 Tax=Chitinophaga pinensis TaxID=79329 RepID=A0A5C6LMN9_9BACT|nr:hypothetical protein [Chitinophaga pinensis]TWV93982.1 hypothetical protein FEF09_26210 [Chitinophaga pinensis]
MSELRSLYVSIKTKKENLERFFNASPQKPVVDQDWITWWDSREMYSKSALDEIPFFNSATNGAILASYKDNPQTAGTEIWDAAAGTWTFDILFLSENYLEIMPVLAWLKGMAPFLEEGDEGVAIIYDYFWGDKDVMAHLAFKDQQATFKLTSHTSKLDKQVLAAADATLQLAYDRMSELYKDVD